MRKIISVLSVLLACSFLVFSQEQDKTKDPVQGLWLGTMKVTEKMSLQLAFQIELGEGGNYTAKLNVIEQNAFDIPMNFCEINSDSVHFRMDASGISYDGIYNKEKDRILGIYSQGGGTFPLNLDRVDKLKADVNRPQTPLRPFPYDEQEVKFENSKAGISLAGTLTMPKGGKNLPAVLLVAGSGKNDRNETEMGHFLLLSDYLTRNGYAVLRYDKRGAGESGGDYGAATTFDFADDSRAALEFLTGRPEINPKKIGIIGHSEGAIIAPMLAAEDGNKISFIILMGGVGIKGSELMLLQFSKIANINGVPEEQISQILQKYGMYYDIAVSMKGDTLLGAKLKEADPEINEAIYNTLLLSWFNTFLSMDPSVYLKRVKCPVLALTGENDLQCPPAENLQGIENALKEGGNKKYTVKTIPGVNHLFQTSESGSPTEYGKLEEIISPGVLQLMLDWMDGVVKN